MPTDRRPLDHVLAEQVGKPEEEVVAWWKMRLEQIAVIPATTARAGALIPEWRELAALPKAQRVALTRARVLGFMQLPADQQAAIFEAGQVAAQQVPEVAKADDDFFWEVVPTLPAETQQRIRAMAAQK